MTEELKQLREALRRVKHEAASLADAQVIALEALTQRPAAQAEREAWAPYLVDRADGVKGHYAIGRWNPRGCREVWNLHSHRWAAYSDDVMSLEEADSLLRQITIPTVRASLPTQPAAQATPEPLPLGPLAKRNIYDAIRGAYDLGYNDARNARTVPGDSASGYKGRDVEEDHGGALFSTLSRRLTAATPEPVQADSSEHLRVIASLGAALRRLSFAAQTSGGTAGPDAELQAAIGQAEQALSFGGIAQAMFATPPQQAAGEPVEEVVYIAKGHLREVLNGNTMNAYLSPEPDRFADVALFTRPAPGVPELTGEMVNAAHEYLNRFKHWPGLPDQFRWHELWSTMLAAAQAKGGE